MKRFLLFILFFSYSGGQAQNAPTHFVLLSICIDKDVYRFSLLSQADFIAIANSLPGHRRQFPPRVAADDPNAGYLPNASALKRTIADRVPEGSIIEWRG